MTRYRGFTINEPVHSPPQWTSSASAPRKGGQTAYALGKGTSAEKALEDVRADIDRWHREYPGDVDVSD